jgi:outer membrane protein assembly factor BamB
MRSKMHSEETFLLSSQDGHVVWHRDKQISKRAVGGNSFAVADYDGDGLDDLASLWPSILYTLKGSTGQDILAMDAKWKQVYAKQVYFGHAVAGDFLNEGKPALYFSGQLMTGVIRLDGTLVWFDALDKSPAYLPSFGDFDGDGRADAVGVGYEDGVRCYDLASGKVKWQMPNPGGDFESFKIHNDAVKGTASADLDGDGRDEALVVIDKTLYCLGAPREGSAGELRWKVEFPAVIGPPSVVALDKEGHVSILVVGSDGYVYCLK